MVLALFYSAALWSSVRRGQQRCRDWERDPDDPDFVFRGADPPPLSIGADGILAGANLFYCPESYREKVNSPAYRAAVQALIGFCALLWIIHFTLFVRACVETHRRNREPPILMVYQQPMWPAPYGTSHPYGNPYRDPYGDDAERRTQSTKQMDYP
ncbi:hypothetical protein GGR52DRAFT_562674 [Hypoxylon sp. FL1284]|nr:hypothetical protein GGR52DRAFT_562674 [Hypoxylon sp. FL1284]